MSALGDLYLVTVKTSMLGTVEAVNAFTYRQISTTGTAAQLVSSFAALYTPAWEQLVSNQAAFTQCSAINLFNPADFFDSGISSAPGLVGGDCMPPFVAFGFTSSRTTRLIRRGQKRIMGVPEPDVVSGELTAPALARANIMAAALGFGLSGGSPVQAWTPVVVKRIKYLGPGGEVRYRLPANALEAQYMLVSWEENVRVTSQTSRKV